MGRDTISNTCHAGIASNEADTGFTFADKSLGALEIVKRKH